MRRRDLLKSTALGAGALMSAGAARAAEGSSIQPPRAPASDRIRVGMIGVGGQQHGPHVRNFLDCVKSRAKPNADIQAGHDTNTVCRLGNIAYRVNRRLQWDAAKEEVVGDAEANAIVIGTYREPWVPRGLRQVETRRPSSGAS